ncbi:hypothetical protein QYE76_026017 [Lolium multiflorum]|uniref:Integrase catalytic domain-containing protein n=1 Tax=Lolium multiflorum TaxID=4521 RepID=A0AAD8RGP2_LOLMU|nr:hypothetical protein QYE76_026017 [Lolium multiflorum]
MLEEVNINPLPPFGTGMGGDENDGGDEGEEDEGDEGVVEVEADGNRKKRRANNYTKIEDATLCRVWASVGMDAVSGTNQTGKRASIELWRIIVEGFKPYNPDKLTRREAVDSQLNNTALHMIQTSVGTKDLSRVRHFTTAKEAWEGLAASCIGSESTRRNKYNALRNKAEGFMRLPDEDHEVMYGRLLTVADAFRNVGATHINDSWIKEKYIDCMMPFEPIDVKTLVGRECYPSLTSQQAVHEMQALKVLEQNSHDSRNRALGKGSNLALVVNSVEEVIPQESYRASWSMSYPEDLEHHYHDYMAFHANTFWIDPSKSKEDNIKRNNSRGFTSSGPRTRSCYNCDDKRHFIAECPYENRENHGGRLIPKDKIKDSKGNKGQTMGRRDLVIMPRLKRQTRKRPSPHTRKPPLMVKPQREKPLMMMDYAAGGSKWVLDSGCTSHMTGGKNLVKELRPNINNITISFGDNSTSEVLGFGKVVVAHNITLVDVMLVKTLGYNLLSVSALGKMDYKSRFRWVSRTQLVCGGLFGDHHDKCDVPIRKGGCGLVVASPPSPCQHENFAKACVEGKMHDSPHPSKTIISSKRILELLHVDLFGPVAHASLGAKKHCLVIVDDYSRYTWVYFLKTKDETQKIFIDFATEVQRQHNLLIMAIRSDNDSEFKNYTLNDFLSDEGIRHQYSAAYNPQQNGVVERKNQTLMDMARSMMADVKFEENDGSQVGQVDVCAGEIPQDAIVRMGVGFSDPLRDTVWRLGKDYALPRWSPHLLNINKPLLVKQMMHQPKNKNKTLPLVCKIKDKINQAFMMAPMRIHSIHVIHLLMSKIKYMMLSTLKKLRKLKLKVDTSPTNPSKEIFSELDEINAQGSIFPRSFQNTEREPKWGDEAPHTRAARPRRGPRGPSVWGPRQPSDSALPPT